MTAIKTPAEIEIMKEGGRITAKVLKEVLASVKPGVRLGDLDEKAEDLILSCGAKPSFKMVEGYNFATCINVNEGVVHGIPEEREVKEGDIVSIDLGAYYKGFHTDAAWTVLVEGGDKYQQAKRFLKVGRQALTKAIDKCIAGGLLSDISAAIQETIEDAGYSVVRELVGHGIGRSLHEPPDVPGYIRKSCEFSLETGLVLAIEVIYNKGDYPVVVDNEDSWTIRSGDGSISGLFEHTVAIRENNPIVLTNINYAKK